MQRFIAILSQRHRLFNAMRAVAQQNSRSKQHELTTRERRRCGDADVADGTDHRVPLLLRRIAPCAAQHKMDQDERITAPQERQGAHQAEMDWLSEHSLTKPKYV